MNFSVHDEPYLNLDLLLLNIERPRKCVKCRNLLSLFARTIVAYHLKEITNKHGNHLTDILVKSVFLKDSFKKIIAFVAFA